MEGVFRFLCCISNPTESTDEESTPQTRRNDNRNTVKEHTQGTSGASTYEQTTRIIHQPKRYATSDVIVPHSPVQPYRPQQSKDYKHIQPARVPVHVSTPYNAIKNAQIKPKGVIKRGPTNSEEPVIVHQPKKQVASRIPDEEGGHAGANIPKLAEVVNQYEDTNFTVTNEICNYNEPQTWDEAEMLSHVARIDIDLARNFVGLLNNGCTLPFIARYRKRQVFNLMPDRLQDIFVTYEKVTQLNKKVKSVLETLKKSNKLTPDIEKSLKTARSLAEVEFIYAPLKSQSISRAEKARHLGLETVAAQALRGDYIDLDSLCSQNEELSTPDKVERHIISAAADIIYKDGRVLDYIRVLKEQSKFVINVNRTSSSFKPKTSTDTNYDKKSDPDTYQVYFDWKCPVEYVKIHQTLAINRGEEEHILHVEVVIPGLLYNKLEAYCQNLWKSKKWINKSLSDAYNNLIKPWLSKQVRADLTNTAYREALQIFTTNLEQYLLTEPIKNRVIAGLDPGFRNGCKVGVINPNGRKLEACTLYPNLNGHDPRDSAARMLKVIINRHHVEIIGLGNGTACRETETWLKNHNISDRIPVIIVSEHGASIYSISKEAQMEHPNMDPNLISALSIARRVLDPLGELIKVDPKSLGVGLYQHDIPPKMLQSALDYTVEKVVSLLGVDINTASHAMLRRISGLNEERANYILQYRHEHGGFSTRSEILNVHGIGKLAYQQCAGFLKVLGGPEPLDATIIHPEFYRVARSFANKMNLDIEDLSQPDFPETVEKVTARIDLTRISKDLGTDVCTLELIINAFKQKAYEDNIITYSKPVYSVAVHATEQIKEGMTLTGVVRNVVPFGCFVDVGVGEAGLVHRKQLGARWPRLGDRVTVTVLPAARPDKLQLRLDKILQ